MYNPNYNTAGAPLYFDVTGASIVSTGTPPPFDPIALWNKIQELEKRIAELEAKVSLSK